MQRDESSYVSGTRASQRRSSSQDRGAPCEGRQPGPRNREAVSSNTRSYVKIAEVDSDSGPFAGKPIAVFETSISRKWCCLVFEVAQLKSRR